MVLNQAMLNLNELDKSFEGLNWHNHSLYDGRRNGTAISNDPWNEARGRIRTIFKRPWGRWTQIRRSKPLVSLAWAYRVGRNLTCRSDLQISKPRNESFRWGFPLESSVDTPRTCGASRREMVRSSVYYTEIFRNGGCKLSKKILRVLI
jgi:hypothetical protein